LRRGGVGALINDFLDTIFNLGVNLQDEELRERSPLVYADHDPIREDQIFKEVKVRLSNNVIFSFGGLFYPRLRDYHP